jgi:hypothetical protein
LIRVSAKLGTTTFVGFTASDLCENDSTRVEGDSA